MRRALKETRVAMWRILALFVFLRLSECKVRLVGGSTPSEGRVEIFHNGRWGTVCDDDWDIDDARVVCRSLGLPDAIGVTTLANYGGGSGEIWLDGVQCRGNEKSLADCQHNDRWGVNNCAHGEDAGVVCGHPHLIKINVSSVSGVITSPGYPLYKQRANYQWTFRPTTPNTNVFVCFEDLNLRTYGKGSFRAAVEDPSNGELFSLENSRRKGVCVQIENTGGKLSFYASLTTPRDDRGKGFRLRYAAVDRSQAEGFCSSNWDISAKGEAGRIDLSWKPPPKRTKSGYTYLVVYKSSTNDFRANLTSSTSVVIMNLDPSTEYSIRVVAIPLANQQSSALYSCNKRVRTKKEQTRVTGGKSASEGYVQVYHDGQWTRVCGNYWWNRNAANVACRSMGLVAAKQAYVTYSKITKKNQQILLGNTLSNQWLSGLRCTGREQSLLDCRKIPSYGWTEYCYNDAGLVCQSPEGKLRLTGGKFPNEGLLEILYGGRWSTICGGGWDIKDAIVACRQLGLPPATFALRSVLFGYTKPKSKMAQVRCKGREKRLKDCPHYSRGIWVRGRTCPPPAAVVCGHPKVTSFNITSLTDMLTSPGFPKLDQAHYEWTFRPPMSSAKVLLCIEQLDLYRGSRFPGKVNVSVIDADGDQVYRMGNGGAISSRIHVLIDKNPSKLVFRSPYTFDYLSREKGFKMRYFVFDESCKGNWNISIRSDSGSIDLSWSLSEPKSLKFKYAIVYYPSAENIKSQATKSTSIKLDTLEPNTEYVIRLFAFVPGKKNLYFCTRRVRTDHVMWRLSGGKMKNEGIAEVNYKGEWGQLCSLYIWTQRESDVFCRSLGLPNATATVKHKKTPNMKSWMYYFKCSGKENNLQECPHAVWGSYLTCPTVPKVVCGSPKVERHINITDQIGFITSPGYPHYMLQAHHEWTFISSNPNRRFLMEFLEVDLKRKNGPSKLIVKNSYGRRILYAEDKKLLTSPAKRFILDTFPVNMTYLSLFTPDKGGKGMRMRYTFFDDFCSSDWTPEVKAGIGKLDVSWASQSNDSDYDYLIVYNRPNRNRIILDAHSPGATIDYLPPNTMYKVTVLALHKNETVAKYCTRHVRTKPETFRIAGGRVPNEGRVEVYRYRKWGVVCKDDWDMDDAKVACRVAGFPDPTTAFGGVSGYNPFETKRKQPYFLGPLQCKGFEANLWDCPKKKINSNCKSWWAYPAGVVCGSPPECKTVLKDSQGTIQSERYFTNRRIVDCEWIIAAPSKTSIIVLSLRNIKFSSMAFCRESSVSYIDSQGRVALRICGGSQYKFVMTGFVKIRLFSNFRGSVLPNMKVDYFVSNDKIDEIVEAPNWNLTTAQSKRTGKIQITWKKYQPTAKEKSQNLNQVVKYVPVCVVKKNGRIMTAYPAVYSRGPKTAYFKDLKYGEYTVYVLAYLGDSRNTPLKNWKKAARKSGSITLKTKQGIPLRAPTNVTATTTGTNSIMVTWDPIPEEYVDGILAGYKVYKEYINPYRGKVVDYSNVYGRNNTVFKISQAFSNTTYTFQVQGFTWSGKGPRSSKVSATTGYRVRVRTKYAYGYFQFSNGAPYPSNVHKTWIVGEGKGFAEILVVFKAFDLESSPKCSNDYVKVTDGRGNLFGGRFCGNKTALAVSVIKKYATAYVTFHSNAAIEKSGFSAFFKGMGKLSNKKRSVWNLQVHNTSTTGAVVSWHRPNGKLSDIIVLYKESNVSYVWQGVKANPLVKSIILKDLLPAKQYHVRLVGTIFDIIQESRKVTFTTKGGAKHDAGSK